MSSNIDELVEKSKIKDITEIENSVEFKTSENKHFHWLRIIFIWTSGLVLIATGLIMAWHFVAPEKWRWLSEAEITNLKNMATTGILAAVLGKFSNRLTE